MPMWVLRRKSSSPNTSLIRRCARRSSSVMNLTPMWSSPIWCARMVRLRSRKWTPSLIFSSSPAMSRRSKASSLAAGNRRLKNKFVFAEVAQKLVDFSDRQRLADQISLHHITTQIAQIACLSYIFHTLGNDFQSQALSQRNDGFHNGCIAIIFHHVVHEGHVDFEFVHLELLKIRQRGIACAEIVDRQAHSQGAQVCQ